MLLFTPWARCARSCAHAHASSHASHSKEKLLSTCLHHLCLPPMATTQQPQKPWRKAFHPLLTVLSDDCHREQLILPSNLQNLTSTITAPSLHHHCTITAQATRLVSGMSHALARGTATITTPYHCTITAPSLHHHRTITAPSLRHHCAITAPSLHHHCVVCAG